jgi:trehalose-6-phosphatase
MDVHCRIRSIFVGDDVTDEDAINALKGMAFTFRYIHRPAFDLAPRGKS